VGANCKVDDIAFEFPTRTTLFPRSTPIHAARPDRILFVVFSNSSSEDAAWLHNPRSTSCRSFSPGRSASPLAHLGPPRARALRPMLTPSLTCPTRHLRLPMRYGLHPGSRTAIEHGVDSDAPASAAVLPTMARPPPTVRPPLDALVLVLTFRSVPGAAGRSVQKRTGGCLSPFAASHLHPTRCPGTRWARRRRVGRRRVGSHDTPRARRCLRHSTWPWKRRVLPLPKLPTSPRRPVDALVTERAGRSLRARLDGQ
jgi:hypothetical protein